MRLAKEEINMYQSGTMLVPQCVVPILNQLVKFSNQDHKCSHGTRFCSHTKQLSDPQLLYHTYHNLIDVLA